MLNVLLPKLTIPATHCIFLADIHFGVRQNSEEWQNNHKDYFNNFFIPKLHEIKQSLPKTAKLIVFILGDIYDNRKAIDIGVSNIALDIMEDIRKICPVYMMTGNHDLSKKTNYGFNSLRAFAFRDNVYLISEPTEITFQITQKTEKTAIAIPYMGDFNEELKVLADHNKGTDYAFMHTEISAMQMDNGMSIISGVNPEAFSGKIYAGHIHNRQETKKVTYVGSPFQMSRGDIGNEKGLYLLDIKTGKSQFILNDYSSKFINIKIEDYVKMSIDERKAVMDNNYCFIIIDENMLNEFKKKLDIYNLKEGTTARSARPIIFRRHLVSESELDISTGHKESTIDELIVESINSIENITDEERKKLLEKNWEYFKHATSLMSNED